MVLSPDDDQQTRIDLLEKPQAPEQPYGLAAWIFGLLLLLVLRGLLRSVPFFSLLGMTMVIVVVSYLLLSGLRPKMHLLTLAILAAELALLYSLPYSLVYKAGWTNPTAFANLLMSVILTGITGLLLGRGLEVERYPEEVIGICFFAVFVVVNILTVFPHMS